MRGFKRRTRLRGSVLVGAVGVALIGCGGPRAFVQEGFLEYPPRRVAVLPFVITYPYDLTKEQAIPASHTVGRDVFRKTFYYALTPFGYEDLPLADVDGKLHRAFGPEESGGWQAARPHELGAALGVDALIYGEVSRLVHLSTPLYTETSLQASLRMVDASSGNVLWRTRVRAAERGGALIKKGQVVDFLKDQARSFKPQVKFLRVSDVAVRQALQGLPNPPLPAQERVGSTLAGGGAAPRLVILPLATKRKGWAPIAEQLRAHLAASLQEGLFEIIELQRVDAVLQAQGWQEGEPLPTDFPLDEVAEALGADALLRGAVTKWGRSYLVVESWVTAGLQLELIDADSGEVLWRRTRTNRRQAGVLKGPTGYKSIATAPITGLKASNLQRVGQHLARAMAEDLSRAPAVLAYASEWATPPRVESQ